MKWLRRNVMIGRSDSGRSYGRVGPLSFSIEPGFGWARLFGKGVSWKDSSRHELLFSERHGHRRRLRYGTWGFGWLR